MKNKRIYKLFETLYGDSFNRILLKGNIEEGYERHPIRNIKELFDNYEKTDNTNESFISVYDFDEDANTTKWFKSDLALYEKHSIKNCIIIRFHENTDILNEETEKATEIQKFMFIRRSINLGFNKKIIEECKQTASFIKETYDLNSLAIFNGYNECHLYIFFNPIDLKNAQETLYYFYRFIENQLNLEKMNYKNIEPFSQVTKLIGTQNKNTRLYSKPFNFEWDYSTIIKNCENKIINEINFEKNDSEAFKQGLISVDEEISNNPKISNERLSELFNPTH
ncbi:MAG: hypothetical protein E7Z84_00610 [Methanosphaera stadtmanae]|nr:hypothetical protein [Methanosphaera stadtmanae]